MNLDTAKRVAFALLMETGEGVTGKDPNEVDRTWTNIMNLDTVQDLRDYLGEAWGYLLDNYILIWETPIEAPAPVQETTVTEAVDSPKAAPEPTPQPTESAIIEEAEPRGPLLAEKPEPKRKKPKR
jgi:hypothetical protein